MTAVYSPVKEFTGLRAGVSFTNGVGYTDDLDLIEWFVSRGYEIEAKDEPKAAKEGKSSKKNSE